MTLFVPRHGRLSYLTETLMRSQYGGAQGHSKSKLRVSATIDPNYRKISSPNKQASNA